MMTLTFGGYVRLAEAMVQWARRWAESDPRPFACQAEEEYPFDEASETDRIFAKYSAYTGAIDPEGRLVAEIIASMTIEQAFSIVPSLKKPPGKPGPKGPRKATCAMFDQARANLNVPGKEPTLLELATEVTQLKGLPEEKIPNQLRNLQRQRRRGRT